MTEYAGYGVEQLWQMVDAARQGLQPSHDQVAALDRAQQMLSGHAEALGLAREQLAAKWSPETNAASAAYLIELDRLIAAVRETALTCAVNVFHISTVSEAIVQAHVALAPVHKEFVENSGSLARYDAEIEAFGAGAGFVPGGSTIAKGAARLFTSPPVDDGRQEELAQRAQATMVVLAGAAQDGANYIKPPVPYAPPSVESDFDDFTELSSGRDGSRSAAGAVPSPVIDSPARPSPPSGGGAAAPADQSTGSTSPAIAGSGPILSGGASASAPQLPPAGVGPGAGGQPGGFGVLPIGSGSFGPPGGGRATEGTALGRGPFGAAGGRLPTGLAVDRGGPGSSPFGAVSAPRGAIGGGGAAPARVNPPGGVIGGQPGGLGRSGTIPAAGNAQAGRIPAQSGLSRSGTGANNVSQTSGSRALTGRMGGSEPTSNPATGGRSPGGSATSSRAAGGPLRSQPARCARQTAESERQRWDPDNPWITDEGVNPVIMPEPAPGRIDPGPGIIGLSR